MARKAILAFALAAFVANSSAALANQHTWLDEEEISERIYSCNLALLSAVNQFARANFHPEKVTAQIVAMNDLQCASDHSEDNHVNAIIMVETSKGRLYALVHLHFSSEGKWTIGHNNTWQWRQIKKSNWYDEWCNFLKTSFESYRKNLKGFGCSLSPTSSAILK